MAQWRQRRARESISQYFFFGHLDPCRMLGYRHLIAGFSTPHDEESMIRFAEEVLPKLKQI